MVPSSSVTRQQQDPIMDRNQSHPDDSDIPEESPRITPGPAELRASDATMINVYGPSDIREDPLAGIPDETKESIEMQENINNLAKNAGHAPSASILLDEHDPLGILQIASILSNSNRDVQKIKEADEGPIPPELISLGHGHATVDPVSNLRPTDKSDSGLGDTSDFENNSLNPNHNHSCDDKGQIRAAAPPLQEGHFNIHSRINIGVGTDRMLSAMDELARENVQFSPDLQLEIRAATAQVPSFPVEPGPPFSNPAISALPAQDEMNEMEKHLSAGLDSGNGGTLRDTHGMKPPPYPWFEDIREPGLEMPPKSNNMIISNLPKYSPDYCQILTEIPYGLDNPAIPVEQGFPAPAGINDVPENRDEDAVISRDFLLVDSNSSDVIVPQDTQVSPQSNQGGATTRRKGFKGRRRGK